jgi:hypothetical protein
MDIYPLTAGRLQRAEQTIASQVMIGLRFGHFSCRGPVSWTYPSGAPAREGVKGKAPGY